MSLRLKAILQALFVAFIWSTSWVFIKFGLKDIPPLLFAGLRYGIAAACLWIMLIFSPERKKISSVTSSDWKSIILIGIFYYACTQGSQFLGLKYLPTVTVNLVLGMSTIVVALLGTGILKERLSFIQWMGVILTPAGAILYFFPIQFESGNVTGLIIVIIGLFSGAIGTILSRNVNRAGQLHPLVLTTLSISVGGILMLAGGIATEGFPRIPMIGWGIVVWMAIVNTAFTFVVWNQTMHILTAVESSMINNTLMVQVPILAVIFLGETITTRQLIGMGLVVVGVVLVQIFRAKPALPRNDPAAEMGSAQE